MAKDGPFMPRVTITVDMDSHEMGTVLIEKMASQMIRNMVPDERDRILNAVADRVQEHTDKIVDDVVDRVNKILAEGEAIVS